MPSTMMFVTPDPFGKNVGNLENHFIPNYYNKDAVAASAGGIKPGTSGYAQVSRPMHGTQVKPNSYATVRILRADGIVIKVFNRLGDEYAYDASTGKPQAKKSARSFNEPNANEWTDWLLQSVQEDRTEKTQIVETFGDTYIYAFGQKPRVLAFSGVLLNTADFNWKAVFWENWDKYFRATKLVEMNARMYISYDDVLVEGYPLNAGAVQSATNPETLQFSFQFFVTNYVNLEAKRGFVNAAKGQNAVIKAGYPDPEDYTMKAAGKRVSLVAFLGDRSAELAGLAVRDALATNADGSIDLNNPGANLAGRFAFLATQAMNPLSGQTIGGALSRIASEYAEIQAQETIYAIEDKFNLESGEVNAWFGQAMNRILSNADREKLGVSITDFPTFMYNMTSKGAEWAGLSSFAPGKAFAAESHKLAGTFKTSPAPGMLSTTATLLSGMLKF